MIECGAPTLSLAPPTINTSRLGGTTDQSTPQVNRSPTPGPPWTHDGQAGAWAPDSTRAVDDQKGRPPGIDMSARALAPRYLAHLPADISEEGDEGHHGV